MEKQPNEETSPRMVRVSMVKRPYLEVTFWTSFFQLQLKTKIQFMPRKASTPSRSNKTLWKHSLTPASQKTLWFSQMNSLRKNDRKWHLSLHPEKTWWGLMLKPWVSGGNTRSKKISISFRWENISQNRLNRESRRLKSRTERHSMFIWKDGMYFVKSARSLSNTLFSKRPKEIELTHLSLVLFFNACWSILQTDSTMQKSKFLLSYSAVLRRSGFSLE